MSDAELLESRLKASKSPAITEKQEPVVELKAYEAAPRLDNQ